MQKDAVDSTIDGLYWEELISNKLPSLKTFELFFSYRLLGTHHFIDSPAIWLYTSLFNMKRRETSGRCEISPIDNVWRIVKRLSDEPDTTTTDEVNTVLNV